MWPAHITGAPSCDLLPLADDAECHQLYIPPTHRTCASLVGRFFVELLTLGRRGEHTLVYRQCSTLQVAAPAVRDLQQSERAPTTFHSVYCLGDSPTSPGGLECPVMCVTRVPCTENL